MMPPRYVKTIRQELYYEYAKLICRSVCGNVDEHRGFVTDRYKSLLAGVITISGTMRGQGLRGNDKHFCKECRQSSQSNC